MLETDEVSLDVCEIILHLQLFNVLGLPAAMCSKLLFPPPKKLLLVLAAETILQQRLSQWSLERVPIQSPLASPPQWNKEPLVCHVSRPSHTTRVSCQHCVIAQGIGNRGVSAVGDIPPVSACRVIERNLITSPQPPPPPASV